MSDSKEKVKPADEQGREIEDRSAEAVEVEKEMDAVKDDETKIILTVDDLRAFLSTINIDTKGGRNINSTAAGEATVTNNFIENFQATGTEALVEHERLEVLLSKLTKDFAEKIELLQDENAKLKLAAKNKEIRQLKKEANEKFAQMQAEIAELKKRAEANADVSAEPVLDATAEATASSSASEETTPKDTPKPEEEPTTSAEDEKSTATPEEESASAKAEERPEEEDKPAEPKPGIEDLEKDLGYLNIDPRKIYEQLSPEIVVRLEKMMVAKQSGQRRLHDAESKLIDLQRELADGMKFSDEAKEEIRERIAETTKHRDQAESDLEDDSGAVLKFMEENVREVLKTDNKEDVLDDEGIQAAADSIQSVIESTIEMEVQREMGALKKKIGPVLKGALKTGAIIGATAATVGLLTTVAPVGAAIGVAAVGAQSVRYLFKRLSRRIRDKNVDANAIAQQQKIDKETNTVLKEFFANKDKLREQISGHISNCLRQQSSPEIATRLKANQEAVTGGDLDSLESGMDETLREFYRGALNIIDSTAKYNSLSPEEKEHMALTMALSVAQHERGEAVAAAKLAEIREKKPKVYAMIEKYNRLLSGAPAETNDQMTGGEAEKSFWAKNKYDMMSFAAGSAVGVAIRTMGPLRIAAGAVAGAGIGYKVGEYIDKRQEAKAFAEIDKLITEAEKTITDIKFPSNKLAGLRDSANLVQARLETGILESNPLLKSRAENFTHQVTRLETKNREAADDLLLMMRNKSDAVAKQSEEDLKTIESKTKKRKWIAMAVGAVAGGGLAFIMTKAFEKDVSDGPEDSVLDGKYERAWEWKTLRSDEVKEAGDDAAPTTPNVKDTTEPADATGTVTPDLKESPNPTITNEVKPVKDEPLEDIINTKEAGSTDSIWKSTKNIILNNPERFGFTGDTDDAAALSQWAETQTANLVEELNQEQGGNLADLVHDGDKVIVEFTDDKPHLSFSADSGKEAGHLDDTNVEKILAAHGIEVDHKATINSLGDQELRIKTPEGDYRISDSDRDDRLDVINPDGSRQEYSPEEFKKILAEKGIIQSEAAKHEAFVDEMSKDVKPILPDDLDRFVNSGGADQYQTGMYEAAKGTEQVDKLFHTVLASKNVENINSFVADYCRDAEIGDNKRDIFLHELHSANNENEERSLDSLFGAFDKNIISDYDEMRSADAGVWRAVRLGDKGIYALAQKYNTGIWPFRSDHFFIDTNGDGQQDFVIDEAANLKTAFKQGYFSVTEDTKPLSEAEPVITKAEVAAAAAIETPKEVVEDASSASESPENVDKVEQGEAPVGAAEVNPRDVQIALDYLHKNGVLDQRITELDIQQSNSAEFLKNLQTACNKMLEGINSKDSKDQFTDLVSGYEHISQVIEDRLKELPAVVSAK